MTARKRRPVAWSVPGAGVVAVLSGCAGPRVLPPALEGLHSMSAAPSKGSFVDWTRAGTDAFDYHGTWKLLDALTDAAFHAKNRKYALANTAEQRHMGKWSDDIPVKPLQVAADD